MTAATGAGYPASLAYDPPDRVANWRPLVHWLLAIPHFAVLYVLNAVAEITAVISWFSLVFTGKDIDGLVTLRCMSLRYGVRVQTYVAFLVEEYPPFAFDTTAADPGGVPRVRVDLTPATGDRNRLTILLRLLWAIPALVVTAILGFAAAVCVLIGGLSVLFTGSWPDGLRDFVVKVFGMSVRLQAYMFLLTDEYPPLSMD